MIFIVFLLGVAQGLRHACMNRNYYVNCQNIGLKEIPKIELSVTEAVLSNNEILTLSDTLNVEIIDLSFNRLKVVNYSSETLTNLNISHNPIWKFTLLEAHNLVQLDISHCAFNFLNNAFFQNVPNLAELFADNNPLKVISDNFLNVLYVNNARLKNIPFMPNLHTLHISNNPLITLATPTSLRILKASNNKISKIELNQGLLNIDVSKNSLTELILNDDIEILDASWNLLRSINLKRTLKIVKLSNNLLNDIKIKGNLEYLDVSKNPIEDLQVLCNVCVIDCSFCRVKKSNFYKVDFVNLSYNNLESIKIENVKRVDLRHNLLQEVNVDSDFFDLRYNVLNDLEKIKVKGVGHFGQNSFPCDCETVKKLWTKSKDPICDINIEKCLKTRKSASPLLVLIVFCGAVLGIFLVYAIRIKIGMLRSREPEERITTPRPTRRNDLPSYEEALTMAKPEWNSRNEQTE